MAELANIGLNIEADGTNIFATVRVTYTVLFGPNEQSVNTKVDLLGVGDNEPGDPDPLKTLEEQKRVDRLPGQSFVAVTVEKPVDLRDLNEDVIGNDEIQARVILTPIGQTQTRFSNVQVIDARALLMGRT